ncbi:MAG TPA: 2OG-Fe(II) oxygenase [Stellaceae bacterium]|nr:2OG-Fe(II) oxygenase [Stellaceae bacterium]
MPLSRDGIASDRKTAMMLAMAFLDLARLRESPLQREPFEFVVVENFLRGDKLPALVEAFPQVSGHGSYPLEMVACNPLFARLTEELQGEAMRRAIEDKFAVDLDGRPTMITLRGYSDGKDGMIHTDSATKIITVLIYMNPQWHEAAGRLRLLRGPNDLSDYAAEVPPLAGTMVAFRRSSQSFHGHHAHVGKRRSIQLNWVTDSRVVRREIGRHRWSARLKGLNPLRRAS